VTHATPMVAAEVPRPARTLVLGCGSIGQAVVPLLIRDLGFDPRSIRVVEMADTRHRIADAIGGDMLLDLAWNIDANTIIGWCRAAGVRYLNTSVEVWEPYTNISQQEPTSRTLYARHMAMREMIRNWGDNSGPSAIVEHGANPGWVSHEVKFALEELSDALLKQGLVTGAARASLVAARTAGDHARMAEAAGVKVIQIAERDTQHTDRPKEVGEFVNTWSGEGFYEEGVAPAELGWGTHERSLPPRGLAHNGDGPRNQILIQRAGMETLVRTWVPGADPARAAAEGLPTHE